MTKCTLASIISLGIGLILSFLPAFTLKFFLVGLALSLSLLLLAITCKNIVIKYVYILLFSVCLPLTLFEGYASFLMQMYTGSHRQTTVTEAQGKKLSQKHPHVGYVPLPNNQVTVTAAQEGTTLYKATYTTDAHGRRITPPHPQAKVAVLLFGCSFTFGEGLNDTQTMAWQLGKLLGENYQVYNFGYSGYGQHNALAIIENTLPDLSMYEKILTYFVVIPDHVLRVAGLTSGDGPRYEIENGKAVRHGTFASLPPLPWDKTSWAWVKQSSIFKFYRKPIAEKFLPYNTEAKRMALLRAILHTGAETLHQRYAQSRSSILVWPVGHTNFAQKLSPVAENISIVDMEPWLPEYASKSQSYIIPIDRHPNALANELMAKNLAKLVQEQK